MAHTPEEVDERRRLGDLLRYASHSLMLAQGEKKSQPLHTVTGRGDQCKILASKVSPASENTLYSADLFSVDH